jgi:hypothetical protein
MVKRAQPFAPVPPEFPGIDQKIVVTMSMNDACNLRNEEKRRRAMQGICRGC